MAKTKSEGSGNVYKIMDTRTGLYSGGGTYPRFSKKGKIWTQIGHVKTHLNQFKAVPEHWEVVEIEMREVAHIQAEDMFKPEETKGYSSRYVVSAENWEVPPEIGAKGSPEWTAHVRKMQNGS